MTEHQFGKPDRLHGLVRERQYGTCLLCHVGIRPGEGHLHHRVRRRVLGWCPCNLVLLHADCHVVAPAAVHQQPARALELGLIVSSHPGDPRPVPIAHQWPYTGQMLLLCDGGLEFA